MKRHGFNLTLANKPSRGRVMRRCLSGWQLRFRLLLLPLLGCSDDKSVDPATARIEACVRAQEEYLSLLGSLS